MSDAIKAKTMLPIAGVHGETFTAVGCAGRKDGKVSFTFDRAYVGERMSQQRQAPVRGVSVSIAVKLENCGDHPDVRFVQVERLTVKKQGAIVSRGPDSATSKARSGWDDAKAKSRGWQIDALDRSSNPFYVDDDFLGENGSSTKPGKLRDTPNVLTTGGDMGSEFRTCAVSYTGGKGTVLACIEWGYYLDATGVVTFHPAKPKAHAGLVPEVAAAAERWDALPGTMKVSLSR